jgi:starch phosphorylase
MSSGIRQVIDKDGAQQALYPYNDPRQLPITRHRVAATLRRWHDGGGPELRLTQELLLGIGGWRLLGALGIQPEVCHLNEGHAAFAILERARSFMTETGQPFEVRGRRTLRPA